MFCPRCDSKIPDGSNICPVCGSSLAGVKAQAADGAEGGAKSEKPRAKKSTAYAKGSRPSRKKTDLTPMIVAFGLILILIVIIVMIVRSMFAAGGPDTPQTADTPAPTTAGVLNTGSLVVFGAATPTPVPAERPVDPTPTPQIEITPTPAPAVVEYKTLRKGDRSEDVVIMQMALAELGYLTGAADGNFGTGTETAVKNFQKDRGLASDGIAGKMTLEALFNETSVTPRPQTTPQVQPGDILDLPG